jgi:hydrophobic/amphiphilic exporter-1 (mainly G- bacteria), HAE1 family
VVGGLLFSQVVTLYITPVYYVYLDRLQNKFRGKRGKPQRGGTTPYERPVDETALAR